MRVSLTSVVVIVFVSAVTMLVPADSVCAQVSPPAASAGAQISQQELQRLAAEAADNQATLGTVDPENRQRLPPG